MHGLGTVTPITGTFFWPATIAAYIATIDSQIQGLGRDITTARANFDAGFLREWQTFLQEWAAWRAERDTTYGHVFAGGTADAANEYARRYNGFETTFTRTTGRQPSVPTPGAPSSGGYEPYVIAGVAVVGVIGLGYLVSGVAKIYQAKAVSKAASRAVEGAMHRNRRRRRRS
jgi:hypothetical protein